MKMPCKSNDELKELVKEARQITKNGRVADYIPALGKANPNDLSIAINFPDGRCFSAGDIEKNLVTKYLQSRISCSRFDG